MGRMVKAIVLVAGLAALSGCGFILDFFLEPDFVDVGVESVTAVDGGSGGIQSVTIVFDNDGLGLDALSYQVLISNGESLGSNDPIIYEGVVEVDFDETESVTILWSEIQAYLDANSVTYSPGFYYIGVITDPRDFLDNSDPNSGQGVSIGQYEFL